jgi:hypothetical protein
MRLIIIGCEYTGKTTLVQDLFNWLDDEMGPDQFGRPLLHDHFVMPYCEGEGPEIDEEAEQVKALNPRLLEKYSRYMIDYHFQFYQDNHHIVTNWYYGDAVYAPIYYGFGGLDEFADRQALARSYDAKVMKLAPDSVLVLLKAASEAVRQRMRADPHPRCILQDQDVELVLQRFDEEYLRSQIRRRFTLDTTDSTPADTLREFLQKMEPHLSVQDRLTLLTHEHLMGSLPA